MTDAAGASAESGIRAAIERRVAAVRAKDVDAAMTNVADDVLTFDVVNALQLAGAQATRQRAAEWFSSFSGPIGFEMRDLAIVAGGDVAFSHSLNRYSGTVTAGALDMWVRVTTGWRRIGGRWMITHEHNSAPFSTDTGQPMLDAQP
ncbi:YybH family protein [Longimicrobium sp.]|uniref:YybH family protein n=1 Tax=Longimicrobium sp. TaxID=2029185 RepID=UPI002C6AA0AC|nr:nuclear transport factor 2 family protein [Longimicrobium sp.]HSU13052.1 nuclear transport factor 2 family protein [Longimicrobium sp.]